jgi:hypothetical protein
MNSFCYITTENKNIYCEMNYILLKMDNSQFITLAFSLV